MLGRIFPKQLDNAYRGYKLAIWLLALIVLAKLGMSYGALFDTRDMIQTADSIPLDSFGTAGADAVVATTKLLGLNHLLLNVLGLVVLIRWRAMIPFVYLLMTIEQVSRKAVVLANPIARTGAPYLPVDPNLVLIAVLLIGLALSLATPRTKNGAP
jgi:hypothetical protein